MSNRRKPKKESTPSSPGWEVLPCGCGIGNVDDSFVIEPCSMTCENYLYAIAETKRQGKPITMVDMR